MNTITAKKLQTIFAPATDMQNSDHTVTKLRFAEHGELANPGEAQLLSLLSAVSA